MSNKNTQESKNTANLVRFAEQSAAKIRASVGLGETEPFDPLQVARLFNAMIISPDHLDRLSEEDRNEIAKLPVNSWSGGGRALPNGTLLIILNHGQTIQRARVTIMEEIAHSFLKHPMTRLILTDGGDYERDFNKGVENEAFWTAAAALLPGACIGMAVRSGTSCASIAEKYGVSEELVEFRIKVLNLWSQYKKRCLQ